MSFENIEEQGKTMNMEKEQQKIAAEWFESNKVAVCADRKYIAKKPAGNILWALDDIQKHIELPRSIVNKLQENEATESFRDIKNGTSSQALLINLLGMCSASDLSAMFDCAFDAPKITLEYSGQNILGEKRPGHSTAIDAYIEDAKGNICIEMKYCENTFGTTPKALEDYNDLVTEYAQILQKMKIQTDGKAFRESFKKNFQFWRNVMFARETGAKFVLICHKDNKKFSAEAWNALCGELPENMRKQCIRLTIQEIAARLEASANPPAWLETFRERYGL